MIDLPLRRDSHIFGRHGRGNCLIPADEGVAFSCRVGRGGDRCAVVLCNGCDGTTTCGVEGDGILIDLPLRPVFLIARFGVADRRNRRAGQIFVVIPALEGVPGARHICRECCAHAVGIACDILPVCDRTAVRVQGYGIGRGCPLHRQFRHISRNTAAGFVGIAIAVKPHEVAACISVRAGQPARRGSGKCTAVFHNDLNILGAAAQLAAAKVKGNDLQSVRAQRAGVQDFKDGAEAVVWKRGSCIAVGQTANRRVPTLHTLRGTGRWSLGCILSRGVHIFPVFDIACCIILPILTRFVQDRVPFVILRIAVFIGVTAQLVIASYGRCAKRIAYLSAGIVFSENKVCRIQIKPTLGMGHGVIRNEQAVVAGIAILCAAARCGRRGLRRACHTAGIAAQRIGIHCAGVGKRHIVQGAVRQTAVCRSGDVCAGEVKVIGAAGGKGELLVDLVRQLHFPKCAGIVGLMIAVKLLVEHAERLAGHVYAGQVNRCPAACTVCRAVQLHNACIAGNAPVRILNNGRYIFIIAHFCVLVFDLQHTTVDQHRLCRKIVAVAVMQGQLPFISGVFGDRGR